MTTGGGGPPPPGPELALPPHANSTQRLAKTRTMRKPCLLKTLQMFKCTEVLPSWTRKRGSRSPGNRGEVGHPPGVAFALPRYRTVTRETGRPNHQNGTAHRAGFATLPGQESALRIGPGSGQSAVMPSTRLSAAPWTRTKRPAKTTCEVPSSSDASPRKPLPFDHTLDRDYGGLQTQSNSSHSPARLLVRFSSPQTHDRCNKCCRRKHSTYYG